MLPRDERGNIAYGLIAFAAIMLVFYIVYRLFYGPLHLINGNIENVAAKTAPAMPSSIIPGTYLAFSIGILVGIVAIVIWYFAYASKRVYESDVRAY